MPRIEKSRKYISDAFLYLLKDKKYEDITINDIVEKAGVSRMTFYRQFYDKKEILKYILDTKTDEYIAKYKGSNCSIEERILQGVTLLVKERKLTEIIIAADLYNLVKEEFVRAITAEPNFYNSFLIGGLANIYYYYVSEKRTETAEELADIIIKEIDIVTLKEELQKRK